ncbi:DUF4345 family protein [Pontixanthobacter sp.]|uniref:DUF4345 family protein n=1 Tax=Pontixanthobacter sp. TaxID=2792078 RepID=UPI003C7DA059
MRLVLTAVIFLGGLFFLATGMNFLFNPASAAAGFGVSATSTTGLAAIRADMGAFFIVSSLCMMLGAWRRNGDLLLVASSFYAVALLGRLISMGMDGMQDGFWIPMVVEGVTVSILLIGSRVLPHDDFPAAD